MSQEGLLKFLKEYWFILVFIGSIVMWYSSTSSRLTALEAQTAVNSARIELQNSSIQNIQQSLATINTNLEFIKQRLQ